MLQGNVRGTSLTLKKNIWIKKVALERFSPIKWKLNLGLGFGIPKQE